MRLYFVGVAYQSRHRPRFLVPEHLDDLEDINGSLRLAALNAGSQRTEHGRPNHCITAKSQTF